MDSGIGTLSHPYATALGKAMLAFLPPDEQESYFRQITFTPYTSHTICDLDKLKKELAKIKKQGYAVDNEELAMDLYCIGAPIFDFNGYPSYAMSVSGPVRRIKGLKEIPKSLMECAEKLSRQLGFRGGLHL